MDRVEKHEEVVVFYNDNDFLDDLLNIEDTELKIYLNGPKYLIVKRLALSSGGNKMGWVSISLFEWANVISNIFVVILSLFIK